MGRVRRPSLAKEDQQVALLSFPSELIPGIAEIRKSQFLGLSPFDDLRHGQDTVFVQHVVGPFDRLCRNELSYGDGFRLTSEPFNGTRASDLRVERSDQKRRERQDNNKEA